MEHPYTLFIFPVLVIWVFLLDTAYSCNIYFLFKPFSILICIHKVTNDINLLLVIEIENTFCSLYYFEKNPLYYTDILSLLEKPLKH